jgi:hypothetical protein
MEIEKRSEGNQVPESLDGVLNENQLLTLSKMEGFGWMLEFVRRPLFQGVVPMLFHPDSKQHGVLEDTPRPPQSPDHPHPVRPCWSGTEHRHAPGCLPGKSCRTAHRNGSQALPSLSRVTPSAVSEHTLELLGCPISCPFLRPASVLNQGPFPPPALPGFPGTTGLSATPRRPACPSRASGWSSFTTPRGFPCCVRFPCVHAVATTPAQ